ncbi:transcriptional regulator PpsR [Thiocystis violacea]|nr:transcriptional regulator PpsR [Thiocystis violacea]
MIERDLHPDVTLFLDQQGVIQRTAVSSLVSYEALQDWVGRPWSETVEPSGSDALRRMVEDARVSGVSAFLQVNQLFPSGRSLPIEYTTVRLGGDHGLLAVGRSLQAVTELQSRLVEAQQTMERDYWKLREVETRYRLLFRASTDAVLLLKADSLRVVELNPAALALLNRPSQRATALIGRELLPLLESADRDALRFMLSRVAEQGQAPGIEIHFGQGGPICLVQASLLSSESGAIFLLRLIPGDQGLPQVRSNLPQLQTFIERMPDGFVLTDRAGLIVRANQGGLDLMQMPTESSVLHQTLGRWLGRPGADLAVLLANVQRLGAVRLFSTTFHGELGMETDVEISAVGDVASEPEYISLVIRDVGRRLLPEEHSADLWDRLGGLTGLVGTHSLRALVEETVAVVERHYIEEALELTGGNRTATAELLGVSRQSLYVKLNRYGLETDCARHNNVGD